MDPANDAGNLPALALAGAVSEEPAPAESDSVLCVLARRGDDIEGLVDAPCSIKKLRVRLAGKDDGFKLGVRQQAARHDARRQMRAIARQRRRDRRHRRRLHQLGRMRSRIGNADRLQSVFLIKRIREFTIFRRLPDNRLISEFDCLGCGRRCGSRGRMTREVGPDGPGCCRPGQCWCRNNAVDRQP